MHFLDFFIFSETHALVPVFVVGLLSAYFGSFSTGGVSVLWIGFLTLLGISPQLATVTFKLGKIGDTLGGIYLFYKNGHIQRDYLLWWGIALSTGAFLWSYFIFSVPDFVIYLVSGISMLFLAGLSIAKKADIADEKPKTKLREMSVYGMQFILSMFWNLFMAGSGAWYYFTYVFILGLPPLRIKGMSAVFWVCWYVGTFLGVLAQGRYVLSWAIAFGCGMFLWWFLGTRHAIRIGNRSLQKLLLASIVLFACYFLYRGIAHFF